ncbi:PREDICTED: longitudinals lacking protein, isoforms A/B/D/L [Atta cephalotes]|uniref:C2H2-type domain-containing protein n=1 Tax=Atta cephalotes TaxID=12957 RepID=A0A158NT80_ATTCE|nr:PREDICTED: longitudinals lacking protein, isoforms A/B/D/L [Atta cephalotes]XP_018058751.1 PREDICTED: longitudinals lacking protein, isoforms A/B/D/L-like [Atta colombica]
MLRSWITWTIICGNNSNSFLQMLPWPEGIGMGSRSPRKMRIRYQCPRCRKSYSTKSAVTAHYKYDCGKPPRFECPYCGMLSKKKFNVQDHIRHKHPSKLVICNTLF